MAKRTPIVKPSKLGEPRRANRIVGATHLLDEMNDLDWLFEVHLTPEVMQAFHACAQPMGTILRREDVTTALIIGNDDCPTEVWVTTCRPVLYTSYFHRVL